MASDSISVIIPAFGNQHALDLSLATLLSQTMRAGEVIVVDDGSTPPLTVPDWCRVVRIERDMTHRGSSAAKNEGARHATGTYLSFCDSDILHLPDALESLHATMKRWESEGDSMVLLNTMRIGLPDGYKDKYIRNVEKLLAKCRTANLVNDEDMVTSALCYEQNESLISAAFFKVLGGYDEKAFPSWGLNNQDLDLRVALAGGRVSSAIPRISTGKRLHCFHQFHENNCNMQQAIREFSAKWGEGWTDTFYQCIYAMVNHGGIPKRREIA